MESIPSPNEDASSFRPFQKYRTVRRPPTLWRFHVLLGDSRRISFVEGSFLFGCSTVAAATWLTCYLKLSPTASLCQDLGKTLRADKPQPNPYILHRHMCPPKNPENSTCPLLFRVRPSTASFTQLLGFKVLRIQILGPGFLTLPLQGVGVRLEQSIPEPSKDCVGKNSQKLPFNKRSWYLNFLTSHVLKSDYSQATEAEYPCSSCSRCNSMSHTGGP